MADAPPGFDSEAERDRRSDTAIRMADRLISGSPTPADAFMILSMMIGIVWAKCASSDSDDLSRIMPSIQTQAQMTAEAIRALDATPAANISPVAGNA